MIHPFDLRRKFVRSVLTPLSSSLIALAAGIAVSLAMLLFFSGQPVSAAVDFFTGPFASRFYVGTLLNTASLLMWAGVGAGIAIASGNLNLGGEGQIYLAGFITAVVLSKGSGIVPPFLLLPIAGFTACAAAAVCAGVAALFKQFRGSSELLVSFLVSAVTIPIVDAAIAGPFRDTARNLLATPPVPAEFRLERILPPSPLTVSFFAAAAFCLVSACVLYRTRAGRAVRVCGAAPQFAQYAGYSLAAHSFGALCLSGACHGLTGFFAVVGTYYTCHSGFYAGMGWNALSCALIARSNPAAVIPSALLLSWIFTAADRSAMMYDFPFDMTGLIQAAVLFCISARFVGAAKRARSA
ncbi:ABC transporter permease [Treponema brennaborense]|uniref:ABC-type transporter, integral membrane subunit n=1 Tax=Treponema brennaborense (strain DSM 12168 / CIP 105900 / DD5/3) TaxID=906968 RepID=F4LPK4_TREBD|nr:ABC transporter permease [Treponema brennaborense]AEE16015.1 ABC-type transporter, integral membrane subunit [Treponema brennaborense DSM 12168]